jgi:hypothetical protein
MLRMTKTGLLAFALVVSASATTTLAQDDPEAGDIETNLPERKKPVEPESRPRYSGKPGPLRVYGGISLAFGGELKGEEFDEGADLDPTVGLQGGADYVMHEYFSIGGETRFLWWKTDFADDRSFFWDIDLKPRGRYAFDNLPLEVYGALPIGLTVPGIAGELEGKIGWNIGIVAGANWFFNERMGVNAEMGWIFHQFKLDVPGPFDTLRMNQFMFLPTANFIYVL